MVHASSSGFARLRRDLMRRRWRRLEPGLRIQIVVLALLLGAFAFWKLRLLYAGVAFGSGSRGAGLALLATLAGAALLGGAGTAWRMTRRLTRPQAGPAWLVLPAPAPELLRHVAWEAELPMRALAVGALAAWLAATRIAGTWMWVAGAAAFPLAWVACCRAGARLAAGLTLRDVRLAAAREGGSGIDVATLAALAGRWTVRSPGRATGGRRTGAWRRRPVVLAIAAKDLKLIRHSAALRAPYALAVVCAAASIAAWYLPAPAMHAVAFPLALAAVVAFGEALILLGGRDPFAVLRSLPVGVGAIWLARWVWAVVAIALLVAGQTVAAKGPPGLMHVSLAWLAAVGLAITALAVNLQLTLFPHPQPALRVYGLALALAVVCSLAIPMLGWVVLFAGVLHSARRLSRWWRIEAVA